MMQIRRSFFIVSPRQRKIRQDRVVSDLKAKGVHGDVIEKRLLPHMKT